MSVPLGKQVNTHYRDLKIITVISKLSHVIIMRVNPDLAPCCVNRLEVTQCEAPESGVQGSNWRQNKLHCCGIPPPTHSPCSLTRTYSSHLCWRMRVHCSLRSACICLCFPLIVSIIHSSPCHSFAPLLFCSFSQSLPPCFDLCLLFSPTRALSQKHAHAPIYPPTHAVGTGESPTSSTVWRGGYAKKYKNRCGTTA